MLNYGEMGVSLGAISVGPSWLSDFYLFHVHRQNLTVRRCSSYKTPRCPTGVLPSWAGPDRGGRSVILENIFFGTESCQAWSYLP